jgi:hypothetical protein
MARSGAMLWPVVEPFYDPYALVQPWYGSRPHREYVVIVNMLSPAAVARQFATAADAK